MIGIVGGIVGFVIIALLLMSVVLYILVRRSLERRQSQDADAGYSRERKHSPNLSRSSVAASDTPEVSSQIVGLMVGGIE
jgi:predicted LPLAT superfamily acyltransferase